MVDQPPLNSHDEQQPDENPVTDPAETPAGWHDPSIPKEPSRPAVAGGWFTPENAASIDDTTEADSDQPELLPSAAPDRAGAWFAPLDAQLDALLDGAADTIIEHHEPVPVPPAPAAPAVDEVSEAAAEAGLVDGQEATRAQAAADTEAYAAFDEGWAAPVAPQREAFEDDEPTHIISPSVVHEIGEPEVPEPAVDVDSTAAGDVTPVQSAVPGLTPAEAALLAEQQSQAVPSQSTEPVPARPPSEPAVTAPRSLTQFEEVERKVGVLRAQFNAGQISREQLQAELRSLMFQDDNNAWWMIGLDSNRWYRSDGQEWVIADPPGYGGMVRGSGLRTETGLQEVVGGAFGYTEDVQPRFASIEIDEDGMPLPARVPQEDPAATLVSPSAPFMEPMRRSDAATESPGRVVEAPYPTANDSSLQLTQLSQAMTGFTSGGDMTIRSESLPVERGIPVPAQPQYAVGDFPQPDYSAAFGARNRNTVARRIIQLGLVGSIIGMVLVLVALIVMIGYYFYKVDQYKDVVANLSERTSNFETTLILDSQGTVLAEYSSQETGARTEVPLNQISPWLIHATVATENETFYTDPGFSVVAIVRAAVQNVREGDTVSGASTITQQLARALVLETEFASQRTTERKIVEIIVASEIKRQYSKNEILEIYLNEIFYGNRAYGIEAAAQAYFGIPASELNPAQAAFLAGLPQSPATYDPVVNHDAAMARMQTVLRLMSEANGTGCIAIQHADTTPWGVPDGGELCVIAEPLPDGSTRYYYESPNRERQELTLDITRVEITTFRAPEFKATHPHFVNYVWQQLEQEFGSQAVYDAGFRVTTTLDERIQSAAEKAVTDNLASLRNQGYDVENASVVVMQPGTGNVVAMVGSADYFNEAIDGQVNVALTAQQPGSALKPLIYLSAFQPNEYGQYLTPSTVIWDVYTDFNGYIPNNFDGQYHGPKTAREALANSLNVPAVKVLQFVDLQRFTDFAQKAGITFPLGTPADLNAGLSTALGAVEVRLLDMVEAYGMLANNGRKVEPVSILRIEDSDGNVVSNFPAAPVVENVVPAEYAYLITNILADNQTRTQEFSPGWPLELQGGRVAAVKTGTSNDSRDVWAIGYTPQYVTGVWMGNTDNRPMYTLYGSTGAALVWNQVMEEAHAGQPVMPFVRPNGIIEVDVCNDSGTRPSPECAGRIHREIFTNTAPPPDASQDIFRTAQVDSYTGKLANEYCIDRLETRTFLAISDPTAFTWINTTAAGNNWALTRGFELPVQPMPTEYCDPSQPRPQVILSFPPQDMTSEGVVPLRGLITMPNFSYYEILIAPSHQPQEIDFQQIEVFQTEWPQPNTPLGQVDTRGLVNGPYTIRLRVFDGFGQSVKEDIRITVNNPQPTAVPTIPPVLPTPTLAPTLTPVPE